MGPLRRLRATSKDNATRMARGATFYVYALIDPRDELAHYIGCTVDPKQRLYSHLAAAPMTEGNRRRCAWVDELRRLGLRPRMVILEECVGLKAARALETEKIDGGRALGPPLFNARRVGRRSTLGRHKVWERT